MDMLTTDISSLGLKAVKESLDIIIDPLKHGLEILKGEAHDCARKDG